MPNKMRLLIVLHSHQPVGNFHHVFAMATQKCYRPVMEILYQYPDFRIALHFSGPLLIWLKENDSELLDMIGAMYARGQVELLSGAFYEPLLAAIPRRDAITQLKMQNAFLQKYFNAQANGFWLAERIWEPSLPEVVAQANLGYTIVDDTHFYYAGLNDEDMFGYHLTEREGHVMALFPTNKQLRYAIPFQDPGQTVNFLKQSYEKHGPTCATYGDDCEKFGLWPKTYNLVIERAWLKNFIETILQEQDWLQPDTPGAVMQNFSPKGRIYLPTSAYEEMLMWALPWQVTRQMEEMIEQLKQENRYEQMRRFLRGGLWENFLVKYRESNLMHKKMLTISSRLNAAQPLAYDHLLQAQCNCSYWHGLFGGLYLSHIRHAVHSNLITSESLLDETEFAKSGQAIKCGTRDFDLDGNEEVVFACPKLDLVIHPAYGGSVSMLNLRGPKFNLADTLTRRPEAYHSLFNQDKHINSSCVLADGDNSDSVEAFSPHDKIVVKEEGLENFLLYDWYERAVFQDHALPYHTDLDSFNKAIFTEWGDFVDQPYTLLAAHKNNTQAVCHMLRHGHIWSPDGPWPLSVEKSFHLQANGGLRCHYTLNSTNQRTPGFMWGVELNLTLLSDIDTERYIMADGLRVEFKDFFAGQMPIETFSLINKSDGFKVDFKLSLPGTLWSWPVYTVSQSESGLERTYQGTSLVVLWNLNGGEFKKDFSLSMEV